MQTSLHQSGKPAAQGFLQKHHCVRSTPLGKVLPSPREADALTSFTAQELRMDSLCLNLSQLERSTWSLS